MSLCTYADYVHITGDATTASGTVALNLADAQEIVAEHLSPRILEFGTYTETLRIYTDGEGYYWTGRVYPNARPVMSVSVPAGATIRGAAVLDVTGSFPDGPFSVMLPTTDPYPILSVTYAGGWTSTLNLPNTVPRKIQRAIANIAGVMARPASTIPLGALSVRTGDVSVTFATPQVSDADIADILETLSGFKLRTLF